MVPILQKRGLFRTEYTGTHAARALRPAAPGQPSCSTRSPRTPAWPRREPGDRLYDARRCRSPPAAGDRHRTAARRSSPAPGWARRLFAYCLRHRTDLLLAFGAALVAALATATLPLVLRHVVDGLAGSTTASLTPWIGLLAALGAVRFGASFTRRYRSGRLSLGVQYDLRNDAFAALLRLGGAQQDGLRRKVVSRSISDITLIQTLLQFLPNLTGNVLMFVISLVFMAWLSPLLTVVAVVVGPLLYAIALRSRRDLFPANWHAQQEAAEVASTVEATVTGVRVVKGFGQESRELTGLEERARTLFASRLRVVRFTSRYNPALQAVPALGQVAVLALGGWMALHGRISLGTFLALHHLSRKSIRTVSPIAGMCTVTSPGAAVTSVPGTSRSISASSLVRMRWLYARRARSAPRSPALRAPTSDVGSGRFAGVTSAPSQLADLALRRAGG